MSATQIQRWPRPLFTWVDKRYVLLQPIIPASQAKLRTALDVTEMDIEVKAVRAVDCALVREADGQTVVLLRDSTWEPAEFVHLTIEAKVMAG